MIEELSSLIQMPFVQRMFIAGFLASVACGIVGTYVVVKRVVFISGGISHATFGGIGLAYYLQYTLGWSWFNPIYGALLFALAAASFFNSDLLRKKVREDSTIGVLWVLGMSLGALLLNLVDRSEITVQSPTSILFGNILLIKSGHLYFMAGLVVAVLLFVLFFYRDLQILTFDEEFARISEIKVDFLNLSLLLIISLTVVMLIKVVGVVLIIAMLTIPTAIAGVFTQDLKTMMVWATVISTSLTLCGSLFSLLYNVPPGATIVLLMGGAFLLSLGINRLTTGSGSLSG